jgi:hypothetical protein
MSMSTHNVQGLLRSVRGSVDESAAPGEYHWNLLEGLRSLVGCDGALFRPGGSWANSKAFYLDADTRFTDGYVHRADTYRPEVATWCELSKGDRAIIDTEIYSSAERSKMALYGDVIKPARVKSIMGCPLTIENRVVALIFLYRTGLGRPFPSDQARALDPILKGLALAEKQLHDRPRKAAVKEALPLLPPHTRPVFQQLLTGKSEKEIAAALGLTVRTVHKYTEIVYRVLNVNSRAALMAAVLTG